MLTSCGWLLTAAVAWGQAIPVDGPLPIVNPAVGQYPVPTGQAKPTDVSIGVAVSDYVAVNPPPSNQELHEQLQQHEAEIASLRAQIGAQPATFQASASPSPLEEQGLSESGFAAMLRRLGNVEKAIQQSGEPTYPTFRTTGFAQLDTGIFSQDANSKAIYSNIQNGTDIRRARLAVAGNLTEQTKY